MSMEKAFYFGRINICVFYGIAVLLSLSQYEAQALYELSGFDV
jgi:hypothetical protein